MTQPVDQTIPSTRIPSGEHIFALQPTQALFTDAAVTIDRTINGGLNSLATGSTVSIYIDYSPDGGTTWVQRGGLDGIQGGNLVTKGVTQTTETFTVSSFGDQPYPIGSNFRVRTEASTAVRVAGTVEYS